ncbi:ABC transporter ATP-binding protein [uncultured Ruminococcus sp.]|uniref:ABC transporter ATP-binding protein n=1 Tax=uncultured Ruminococcus sp. TaxID=165186 RepID=UPI0026DCF243|nr:ABC transporter ATP-binding protein [uncultured Ruminococcus sp.]
MFIEVKNAVKQYGKGDAAVHALDGASFSMEKGEIGVILGASGSGKSTLMNMLGGIDTLDSGTIIVDGVEISGYRKKQLVEYRREKIGFVFQFYNLIPSLTARENIETTIDIAVNSAIDKKELMDRLDITPFANRYPSELSGGQQQRVAIARAIAKNPALLLCDELTGALDSKSAREVLSFVEKVNQMYHTTVLIITHNETIQGFADVIIHVRDGKVTKQEKNPHKIPVSELEL